MRLFYGGGGGCLTKNCGVYFGSRLAKGSVVKKQKIRNLLGYLLRIISKILFSSPIMDTQCGFKLYKKKIAKKIFSKLITKGFSHDVEIVNICFKFNYKIKELPVNWTHISGGKLNIIYDPLIMFIEIIKIYFSIKNKLPMLKSTF
jgi:dolichyl-phosphate beta-glucosyltransferase